MQIAVDTGGTFTDCVALQHGRLRMLKVRSTPADPSLAVMEAVATMSNGERPEVRHGTTVGTNTMLEGTGARVAFVTTTGFEDTIAIGRQTRPRLYDWFVDAPACLVPEGLRFGVPERVTAEADVLRSPTDAELAALVKSVQDSGAESIAISLLFSFLRPENELLVESALRTLGLPVSTSHRILPEFREYERGSTIVVNAYLAPRMRRYLLHLKDSLAKLGGTVEVMQSSGGIVPATLAAEEPVRTVLSGPAGGVVGAWRMAQQSGFDRILGFDMGGTSTDVFLVDGRAGSLPLTRDAKIAGVPISVPMLDIHTAGAGGGSIARFDAGGLLHVGPQSAGADPGPISFGKGTLPTVTDANLLLGRIGPEGFLDGAFKLDVERAHQHFEAARGTLPSAEAFAAGILRVVETSMQRAIRVVSVERGHDPRQFALVAFGGGGPLHACSLAKALRIDTVLVPAFPGALSAVGILLADGVRDISRTVMLGGEALAPLEGVFAELEESLRDKERNEGCVFERSVDLRYRGQAYELNVPYDSRSAESFHLEHERRYGFCDRMRPLEIVTVRARMRTPGPELAANFEQQTAGNGSQALAGERSVWFEGGSLSTRIYSRSLLRAGDELHGPALVVEYSSTTVLPPHCTLKVDGYGALVIRVAQEAKG